MEVDCSDKHSSLLRYGNKYDRKKFYSTDPYYLRTQPEPTLNWGTVRCTAKACIYFFTYLCVWLLA